MPGGSDTLPAGREPPGEAQGDVLAGGSSEILPESREASLGENLARSHSRDRQGFGGFIAALGTRARTILNGPIPEQEPAAQSWELGRPS